MYMLMILTDRLKNTNILTFMTTVYRKNEPFENKSKKITAVRMLVNF